MKTIRGLTRWIGLAWLIAALPAYGANNFPTPDGARVPGEVLMCVNGSGQAVPCGTSGTPLQVAGTLTASLGGFTPSASGARGTPITVTTSDSSGSLPTGAVVIVSNPGANPEFCNVNGVAATISDQPIAAGAGNWFAFTIPSGVTVLHCIATGGSTTANMLGGAGLPTGAGGGGGGGGGGSVTQGTSPWVVDTTGSGHLDGEIANPPCPTGAVCYFDTNNSGNLISAINTPATLASQYPSGAVPLTASATGTTGATTATLAGTSGKTTYICGYSIRANATAAATVTNTITGLITATMSHIMWVAPAASGLGIDEQIFNPCIPASAANTGIAIVSGAPGSGGNVSSTGWGYQL